MIRSIAVLVALATPAMALAQQTGAAANAQSATGQSPQRIRNVQVQRGERCPQSTADEVVVCQTLEEPYRIPRQFRDDGPIPSQNQSWANRAQAGEEVGRVAAGLPDTCSPVGTGGQSGCAMQANRAYAAERRAQRRAAEATPGGQ